MKIINELFQQCSTVFRVFCAQSHKLCGNIWVGWGWNRNVFLLHRIFYIIETSNLLTLSHLYWIYSGTLKSNEWIESETAICFHCGECHVAILANQDAYDNGKQSSWDLMTDKSTENISLLLIPYNYLPVISLTVLNYLNNVGIVRVRQMTA